MKINDNVEISVRDGMSFTFNFNEDEIVYKGSSLTGKEIVLINGEIVSESKNFKLKSTHQFIYKGKTYFITLEAKNLRKGDIICSLEVDEQLIKTYRLQYVRGKTNQPITFLVVLFGGFLAGLGFASEAIPMWGLVAIICSIAVIGAYNYQGNWTCSESGV